MASIGHHSLRIVVVSLLLLLVGISTPSLTAAAASPNGDGQDSGDDVTVWQVPTDTNSVETFGMVSTAVVAAVAGRPSAVFINSRLAGTMWFASCGGLTQLGRPAVSSAPFGFIEVITVENSTANPRDYDASVHLNSIVSNIVFLAAAAVVFAGAAFVAVKFSGTDHRSAGLHTRSMTLAKMRFPSVLMVPFALVTQQLAKGVGVASFHCDFSPIAAYTSIALGLALLIAGMVAMGYIATKGRRAQYFLTTRYSDDTYPETLILRAEMKGDEASRPLKVLLGRYQEAKRLAPVTPNAVWFQRLVEGGGEWVSDEDAIAEGVPFNDMYGLVYGEYRSPEPWFLTFEAIVTVLEGFFAGVSPDDYGACITVAASSAAVLFVYAGITVVLRPFGSRFSNAVHILVALHHAGAAAAAAALKHNPDSSALGAIVVYVPAACATIICVKLMLETIALIVKRFSGTPSRDVRDLHKQRGDPDPTTTTAAADTNRRREEPRQQQQQQQQTTRALATPNRQVADRAEVGAKDPLGRSVQQLVPIGGGRHTATRETGGSPMELEMSAVAVDPHAHHTTERQRLLTSETSFLQDFDGLFFEDDDGGVHLTHQQQRVAAAASPASLPWDEAGSQRRQPAGNLSHSLLMADDPTASPRAAAAASGSARQLTREQQTLLMQQRQQNEALEAQIRQLKQQQVEQQHQQRLQLELLYEQQRQQTAALQLQTTLQQQQAQATAHQQQVAAVQADMQRSARSLAASASMPGTVGVPSPPAQPPSHTLASNGVAGVQTPAGPSAQHHHQLADASAVQVQQQSRLPRIQRRAQPMPAAPHQPPQPTAAAAPQQQQQPSSYPPGAYQSHRPIWQHQRGGHWAEEL